MRKASIVLSGGGIKGVAHISFLKRLVELEIQPAIISGASAGALIGAFYASGMTSEEMVTFFKTNPLFKMTWVTPSKPGIFDTEKYISILKKYLPATFEELKTPLIIAVVNMEKGCVEYISKGDLYRPLAASCAVPFFFSPVLINGQMYADGGIMDNYPIKPLDSRYFPIYGSYVCYPGIKKPKDLNSALKITNHANNLLLQSANEYKFDKIDHTVAFDLSDFGPFDSKSINQIYDMAEKQMKKETFSLISVSM